LPDLSSQSVWLDFLLKISLAYFIFSDFRQ
jgi:hypothetical protein